MKIKLITALFAALLLSAALLTMQSIVPKEMAFANLWQEPRSALAPFPEVTFQTAEGTALNINSVPEQIILVHFWAAWCAVCYSEFPDLLKYVASRHGKVALLSVSLDDDYGASRKALKLISGKNHLSLQGPHLYWAWDKDKSISLKIFNTVKVPETIVVNEQRLMIDKIVGLGPWGEALK